MINIELLNKLQEPDCDIASVLYGRRIENLDNDMRLAVKACAVPEWFDASIAKTLFEGPIGLNGKTGKAFSTVTSLSFTYIKSDGVWGFFPEARMFLLKELKEKDNGTLKEINEALIEYYGKETEPKVIDDNEIKTMTSGQERSIKFLKAYHKTNVSPIDGFDEIDKLKDELNNETLNQIDYTLFRHFNSLDSIYGYGKENYYYYEGMRLYSSGKRDEAFIYFKPVADSKHINKRVGIASHLVGKILSKKNSIKSEEYYNKSLNIGEELHDKSHQAQVHHSLGNLLMKNSKRHDEAEKHFNESLNIGKKLHDKMIQAQVLNSLGILLAQNQERHKEAEDFFYQSIKANSNSNHTKKVYTSLAKFYNERGDHLNAIKAAEKCHKILDGLNYKDDKARTMAYNEMGHAFRGLAQFDDALINYNKALDLEKGKKFKEGIGRWIDETQREKEKIALLKKRFKEEGWDVLEGLTPSETLNVMCGIYEGNDFYNDFMEERERERKRDD